jgi:hypothetical protein
MMNVPLGVRAPSRSALIKPDTRAKNITRYITAAISTNLEALKIMIVILKSCV